MREVRAEGNYDADKASVDSGLLCEDESLAVQSDAEDADINTIVRRFGITGTVPVGQRVPTYGDFTEVSDFQSALHSLQVAEEAFMAMPWDIRSRFQNDPHEFVAFCSDPANLPEMRKMGLAVDKTVVDTDTGTVKSTEPLPEVKKT